MKVVICASMSAAKKTVELADRLHEIGFQVVLPRNIEKYAEGKKLENKSELTQVKIDNGLIKKYYDEIKDSDAVLVVNEDKNGIENYIGGNTFLEMGFAHVLGQKIYLLNPIPDMIYTTEIIAMRPEVIEGDLSKIK